MEVPVSTPLEALLAELDSGQRDSNSMTQVIRAIIVATIETVDQLMEDSGRSASVVLRMAEILDDLDD